MRKLLDTTFLVHYLTRPARVESYLEAHATADTTLLGSAISMKELAVGLGHVESNPDVADLTVDFGWLEVLPFTTRHAFAAGRIEGRFQAEGFPQDRLNALGGDVLIGGVALAEEATVVTENVADFQLMGDVRTESY